MTADLSQTSERPLSSRPTKVEWWLVALVFLTGAALRTAWPSRMAVEHFDEGVYASNVFFFSVGKGDERYPDQHLYAPPLLPLLIEFAMLVLGPTNFAAMVPSLVAGSFTVPVVWWVGRRWFGPTAGLASATLVALNDVHILFSRTALTDVLLCFWLITAVYLFWEAQTTGSRLALFAAGVVTGLAWWTKYNGWLPLAIGMAGVVPWRVFGHSSGQRAGQAPRLNTGGRLRPLGAAIAKWAVIAVVAFLIWAPWLWSLQSKGGYAAVMDNHSGYLVGVSGWWNSSVWQNQKLRLMSGASTTVSFLAAWLLTTILHRWSGKRFTWNLSAWGPVLLYGIAFTAFVGVTDEVFGVLVILGPAGVVLAFRPQAAFPDVLPESLLDRALAAWLLTAWFSGLLLMTPCYTPYPRLMLPWLVSACFGVGIVVHYIAWRISAPAYDRPAADQQHIDSLPQPAISSVRKGAFSALFCGGAGILALVFLAVPPWQRGPTGCQSRIGLVAEIPQIIAGVRMGAAELPTGDPDSFVIYTYADPALMFQLREAGVLWARPIKDLGFASPNAPVSRLPVFVVIGPQARHTAGFDEQFEKVASRLELIGAYRHSVSQLVLLDEPRISDNDAAIRELELYRVKAR
jgi:dolichyl-phosphate-mannose-protein mannosyltransferase